MYMYLTIRVWWRQYGEGGGWFIKWITSGRATGVTAINGPDSDKMVLLIGRRAGDLTDPDHHDAGPLRTRSLIRGQRDAITWSRNHCAHIVVYRLPADHHHYHQHDKLIRIVKGVMLWCNQSRGQRRHMINHVTKSFDPYKGRTG